MAFKRLSLQNFHRNISQVITKNNLYKNELPICNVTDQVPLDNFYAHHFIVPIPSRNISTPFKLKLVKHLRSRLKYLDK